MSTQTFVNPPVYTDGSKHTNPDPFMISFLGKYFCYSTGIEGVNLSVSTDLIHWEHRGFCYQEEGRSSYWAPCVIYRNGMFYMYVSNRPEGAEDPHLQRMRVATSPTPEGPFSFHSQLLDRFTIDADVVTGNDGVTVMFYACNDLTEKFSGRIGTGVVVDVMPTLYSLAGSPKPVIMPSIDQEIFERNRFGDGRDWFTIEGSTYFSENEFAYQTYSGNAYENPDYFIGLSRTKRAESLYDLEWEKVPSDSEYAPLIRQTSEVEGTGHNSMTRAPNLLDRWICYHGRDRAEKRVFGLEQRQLFVDQLFVEGGEVLTAAPTCAEQPIPKQPTYQDRTKRSIVSEVLGKELGSFAAEIYLKLEIPGAAETESGIHIILRGREETTVAFELSSAGVSVTGKSVSRQDFPLLTHVDLTEWQQIRLFRKGERIELCVGDVTVASVIDQSPNVDCDLLIGAKTGAKLGYWRLTDFYELSRDQLLQRDLLQADTNSSPANETPQSLTLPRTGRVGVELYFDSTDLDKFRIVGFDGYLKPVLGRNRAVISFEVDDYSNISLVIKGDFTNLTRCRVMKMPDLRKASNNIKGVL